MLNLLRVRLESISDDVDIYTYIYIMIYLVGGIV